MYSGNNQQNFNYQNQPPRTPRHRGGQRSRQQQQQQQQFINSNQSESYTSELIHNVHFKAESISLVFER